MGIVSVFKYFKECLVIWLCVTSNMDKYKTQWKLLYLLGLFWATFILYLTPIIIIRKQQLKSWTSLVANHSIDSPKTFQLLSVCNCLSAGIFLGICFLDLIPYVEREFRQILKISEIETNFPVGQFIIILGVLLVLSLETVIRHMLSKSSPPVLDLDDNNSNVSHFWAILWISIELIPEKVRRKTG